VLFKSSQEAGLNGIYFVKFGLRMGRDIELYFVTENSNKSLKPSLGRKSQLRTWSHLEIYHSIQSVRNWDLPSLLFKRSQ
jgi:hypothetical protein